MVWGIISWSQSDYLFKVCVCIRKSQLRDWHIAVLYNLMICGIMEIRCSWAQAQAGDIVRALAISRSRDQVSPSHCHTHPSPMPGQQQLSPVLFMVLTVLAFLVANDTAYIHSRSYCPTLRVAPTQHSRTRSLSTRVWLCCCKVNGPL